MLDFTIEREWLYRRALEFSKKSLRNNNKRYRVYHFIKLTGSSYLGFTATSLNLQRCDVTKKLVLLEIRDNRGTKSYLIPRLRRAEKS